MAATAISLRQIRSNRRTFLHNPNTSFHLFSTSPSPENPHPDSDHPPSSNPQQQQHLKQSPLSPSVIQEIRESMAEFRLRSNLPPSPPPPPRPSSTGPTLSLQELYERNVSQRGGGGGAAKTGKPITDKIRESLRSLGNNEAAQQQSTKKIQMPEIFKESLNKLQASNLNKGTPESVLKDKQAKEMCFPSEDNETELDAGLEDIFAPSRQQESEFASAFDEKGDVMMKLRSEVKGEEDWFSGEEFSDRQKQREAEADKARRTRRMETQVNEQSTGMETLVNKPSRGRNFSERQWRKMQEANILQTLRILIAGRETQVNEQSTGMETQVNEQSRGRGLNDHRLTKTEDANLVQSLQTLSGMETQVNEQSTGMKTQVNEQSRGIGLNKRRWTMTEDANLVQALQELSSNGDWKCDNGTFKDGYLVQLEKILEEKLPGAGLKSKPHIEARVKLLKKQYHAIAEMLGPNASGFSWNSEENYVTADKDVFDDWVKSHPAAKGLLNKFFPHYEELAQVFGKDRATGECAQVVADAVEEIDRDDTLNGTPNEDGLDNIESFMPFTQNSTTTSARASNQHRRKRIRTNDNWVAGLAEIANKLGSLFEGANENIAKLVECFQFEADGAQRRMKVFEEIQKIPDMDDMDRLKAGEIIIADANKIDFFFSLPESFKKLWIIRLLEKAI